MKLYAASFLFLLTLVAGYALFQARNIIVGPIITLQKPITGTVLEKPLVTIAGTARNVSFISLNDNPIFVDENGHFEEQLLVSPGYSIMTVIARDRFDRSTTKIVELVL